MDIRPGFIVRKLIKRGLWLKLFNYILAETEARAGNTRLMSRPYWLTIDPTNFCQLRCPFCPTGAKRKVRPESVLDPALFKKVIDELGKTLLHIDFMNWGEPLLSPHVCEMIAIAKKYRIETALSTNLNRLTPETAGRLVESGLDRLTVSIDGASQQTYGKYRVGGDFDRVIENLKTIIDKKKEAGFSRPKIMWQFLVFRHNEHEIARAREMASGLGVEIGFTAPCLPFKPGIKENWMPRDRKYCLYDPDSFPEKPPWEWADARDENGKPRDVAVEVYAKAEKRGLCKWPWAGITVNADGSVSPCCSVEESEFDFGDITGRKFAELWNGESYRKARRHILDFAAGKKNSIPASAHACERCFSIGKADFQMPHWWHIPDGETLPDALSPVPEKPDKK